MMMMMMEELGQDQDSLEDKEVWVSLLRLLLEGMDGVQFLITCLRSNTFTASAPLSLSSYRSLIFVCILFYSLMSEQSGDTVEDSHGQHVLVLRTVQRHHAASLRNTFHICITEICINKRLSVCSCSCKQL